MALKVVAKVARIELGSQGLRVSAQGLGCSGLTTVYAAKISDIDKIKLIRHAIATGVTFFDTSDVYGPHTNEVLMGEVFFIFTTPSVSKLDIN